MHLKQGKQWYLFSPGVLVCAGPVFGDSPESNGIHAHFGDSNSNVYRVSRNFKLTLCYIVLDFTSCSRKFILTLFSMIWKIFSVASLFREIMYWQFPGSAGKISRFPDCFEKFHAAIFLVRPKKFLGVGNVSRKLTMNLSTIIRRNFSCSTLGMKSATFLLWFCCWCVISCWYIFTISEPGLIVLG